MWTLGRNQHWVACAVTPQGTRIHHFHLLVKLALSTTEKCASWSSWDQSDRETAYWRRNHNNWTSTQGFYTMMTNLNCRHFFIAISNKLNRCSSQLFNNYCKPEPQYLTNIPSDPLIQGRGLSTWCELSWTPRNSSHQSYWFLNGTENRKSYLCSASCWLVVYGLVTLSLYTTTDNWSMSRFGFWWWIWFGRSRFRGHCLW